VNRKTIACTLTNREQVGRRERWLQLRERGSGTVIETPTGLRLSFRSSAPVEQELRALAKLERDCCAFASWTVREDGSVLVLDVEAEGDAVAAVHGMFSGFPRGG
jgi:hypothetical protein